MINVFCPDVSFSKGTERKIEENVHLKKNGVLMNLYARAVVELFNLIFNHPTKL